MNRVISGLLTLGLTATLALNADRAAAPPLTEPTVTLLDLHPADFQNAPNSQSMAAAMPRIVRQGDVGLPDQRQVIVPAVVTPSLPGNEDPGGSIGKAAI